MIEGTIHLKPVSKPRMTQRDKWDKRKCVVEYFNFCNSLRSQIKIPKNFDAGSIFVIYYVKMPKSWSIKKKVANLNQINRQKPDTTNYNKAFEDALFKDDQKIFDIRGTKFWSDCYRIKYFIREPHEISFSEKDFLKEYNFYKN